MIRHLLLLLTLLLSPPALASSPVLYLDDRALLNELEGKGFAFEELFGTPPGEGLGKLHDRSAAYRAIVSIISADVAELRAEMKAGARTLYEVTDGNVGRVMDMRWLTTDAARLRLVGLVNRMDRKDFSDLRGEQGCGEVRLIYRLAYRFMAKGRTMASRMPFNVNAVYTVAPDPDAAARASRRAGRPVSTRRSMPAG